MNAEPYALTVVSGYEFLALVTGKVPTITTLVRRRPLIVRFLLALGAGVYLLIHFWALGERREESTSETDYGLARQ